MASINGRKVNNAKMYDKYMYESAGLTKSQCEDLFRIRNNFKNMFDELDLQENIRSFRWYNLPSGLSGELLERILYYRGCGMFFYMEDNDTYYFLPFSLNGNIDVYGRYLAVTPLPFGGPKSNETDKDGNSKPWIPGLVKFPVYDLSVVDDLDYDELVSKCVLLFDRSRGLSQFVEPRYSKISELTLTMAETLPLLRTNMLACSGIKGYKVPNEDAKNEVYNAANSIYAQAMSGEVYAPIVSNIDFQDLTSGGSLNKPQDYLMTLQALDNLRLRTAGISNGGLFQKNAHMLETEADANNGKAELSYQDKLLVRQQFCDYVNYVFGLSIWCEPDESIIGVDVNGDGYIGSQEDQSGFASGEQPAEGGDSNV